MLKIAIKFGLFVAVCLTLTGWLFFTIGNTGINPPDHYSLTATFDDVSGLLIDDNVKVAGVVVGKVTGIHVESGRAEVTFQVKKSVRLPASSTTVAIRWRNLIGQRYIYLYPGPLEANDTILESGDTFDEACSVDVKTRCTESVVDLGELFNRLGPIVASIDSKQVNQFLETVQDALSGNESSLKQTLRDLTTVVEGLAERDDAIASLIENSDKVAGVLATRDAQIRQMLDNLATLSGTFNDNTALLEQSLIELSSFNTDLASLLQGNEAEIDRSITNLETLTDVVDANRGNLDTALKNLPDTGAAIFNSSADGEWLNEAILCISSGPPDCPHPIVPGLSAADATSATVFNEPAEMRAGSDALVSIWSRFG